MSAVLAPPGAAFLERARKLARILDERFDGFGELVEGEAIDHAVAILEAIEAKGCRLLFAEEQP